MDSYCVCHVTAVDSFNAVVCLILQQSKDGSPANGSFNGTTLKHDGTELMLTDWSLCCYQSGEEDWEPANRMLSLGHCRWILANEKQESTGCVWITLSFLLHYTGSPAQRTVQQLISRTTDTLSDTPAPLMTSLLSHSWNVNWNLHVFVHSAMHDGKYCLVSDHQLYTTFHDALWDAFSHYIGYNISH